MSDPTEISTEFRTIRTMKFFAVLYEYNADHPRLDDVRPKHREFIGTLKSKDQILGSGPFTDSRGGALIVLQLDSSTTVEDVTTIMDGDPYWVEGLIDKREIREWNPVINSFEN